MDPAQLKKLDVGAIMVIRAYEDSLGTGKIDLAVNAGIFTQVIGEAI